MAPAVPLQSVSFPTDFPCPICNEPLYEFQEAASPKIDPALRKTVYRHTESPTAIYRKNGFLRFWCYQKDVHLFKSANEISQRTWWGLVREDGEEFQYLTDYDGILQAVAVLRMGSVDKVTIITCTVPQWAVTDTVINGRYTPRKDFSHLEKCGLVTRVIDRKASVNLWADKSVIEVKEIWENIECTSLIKPLTLKPDGQNI